MLLRGVNRVDANKQIAGEDRERDIPHPVIGLCRFGGSARDRYGTARLGDFGFNFCLVAKFAGWRTHD